VRRKQPRGPDERPLILIPMVSERLADERFATEDERYDDHPR
jgi:hypothetical protein